MENLLRMIVTELVDDKDQVSITEKKEADKLIFKVKVAPEDIGKVIGKQGRIVKSIRTVIRAMQSDYKKVVIEVSE